MECLKILQSFIFDALPPLEDDGTEDPEKNAEITHLERNWPQWKPKKKNR